MLMCVLRKIIFFFLELGIHMSLQKDVLSCPKALSILVALSQGAFSSVRETQGSLRGVVLHIFSSFSESSR